MTLAVLVFVSYGASGCGNPFPSQATTENENPQPSPPTPAPPDPAPPDPAPPDPSPPDPEPPAPTPPPPAPTCETQPLPLSGEFQAPVLNDVELQVTDTAIVLYAWVSDPQGLEDIEDVRQVIGVYVSGDCSSSTIDRTKKIRHTDRKESFGTVVTKDTNPDLYAAIAGNSTWPVRVDLRDKGENHTTGKVSARVVH